MSEKIKVVLLEPGKLARTAEIGRSFPICRGWSAG